MEHDDLLTLPEDIALTKTKSINRAEQKEINAGKHPVDFTTHISGHLIVNKTKQQKSISYKDLALMALDRLNENKKGKVVNEYLAHHNKDEEDKEAKNDLEAKHEDGKAVVRKIKGKLSQKPTKRISKSSNFAIRKVG